MKRKKRTVEERRADQERYDETTRLLIERIDRTGPASSSATRSITATAVSGSPAMIARSTGAAPRHRGSRPRLRLLTVIHRPLRSGFPP